MSRRGYILYYLTVAAAFIALEAAALSILGNSGQMQNNWLSKGVHAFQAKVWGITEDVRHYLALKQENERLAAENFELAQQLRAYRHLTGKDLMTDSTGFSGNIGNFRYIPATIVKMSRKKQHNYLIIGKGEKDGISPRSGIITENGVIGIVDAVSDHYSYVRSFTNTEMSISARIGHEGAVGILKWNGTDDSGATLSEIPHHIDIVQGDTIYTSGFSAIFPPDIPLGTLGRKKMVNGSSYDIEVRLFEDFSKVRYVTVVDNVAIAEFEELERQ